MRIRLHDGSLQKITVAQAAALQSFPPYFEFPNTLTSERQAFVGLGNAVPPAMGAHLSRHCRLRIQRAQQAYERCVAMACGERLTLTFTSFVGILLSFWGCPF